MLKRLLYIALRECRILLKNPIYGFCMVVFPVVTTLFFTSMMSDGQPLDMPVAVVDEDNTSTTRSLIQRLDAFQNSQVVAHYPTVSEARRAIQQNQIYGFLYIPRGTTDQLLSSRQPKVSFYYSLASVTAGSLVFKDLKTIATLGSAAVGQATMRARGFTDEQIQTFLQPIRLDMHLLQNPQTNYNVYLSTVLIPGVLMLFMFLITAYSIGTELKFGTGREWIDMAGGNILVALIGKLLPQALVFLTVTFAYEYYVFGILGFPHPGGVGMMILLAVLSVLASQGFGVFAFGLMPSLRMSMSICSLWAVLSFSMAGSAFPIMAMDEPVQALSWLFPLRHYYMLYQICVFNGYPLLEAWFHLAALAAFALLPWLVMKKIKNAMLTYVYIP
ncbi:MAG: ABC transporter permease [Prevotella sp.]|nr:ABC transporter permease [Prevotella sp.]